MAKYCTQCGKKLENGEVCNCNLKSDINTANTKEILKSITGKFMEDLNVPDTYDKDIYERNKQIVPECISYNEGEIPVKQYNIATLRSFNMRAEGRMQITNTRLIFRATGRCPNGKTVIQQEYAVSEISGIEARKDYRFSFLDICIGMFINSLISGVIVAFLAGFGIASEGVSNVFSIIILIASQIAFYFFKKQILIKLITASIGIGCIGYLVLNIFENTIIKGLFIGYAVIIYIVAIIAFSFKPNLVISILNKSGQGTIQIRREKSGLFGSLLSTTEFTGYSQVLPTKESDTAIKEIGAIINDIQKLGDFGIEKWKE